jgi:hypothetical protein
MRKLGALATILGLLGALVGLRILPVATAQAQQSGVIVHDVAADFSPTCATATNVTVSDALGGELRLAATLEDYFNGSQVDGSRWLVGSANTWYTAPVTVANGAVTLDAMYLRSQMSFAGTQPRFFETRAQARSDGGAIGPIDLGYYRALPPLDPNAPTATTAFRLFITRTDGTLYVAARDGVSPSPYYSVDLPTVDLAQYHLFRIEWDGAETRYFVNGVQHVDHHTTIDHSKPHGTSRELYKGILDGNSSAVFNGRIIVRKDAQKTDSKQSNKNLVLSEDATINTKPELQILADDVRCTHGATIGQLDADAVFYLQSRGIARQEARDLLTRAFAQEILEDIKVEGFRDRLDGLVWERLHAGRN